MSDLNRELQAERMERQRWWLLVFYIASWFVWQALTLPPVRALPYLRDIPGVSVALGGWAVWTVAMVLLFRLMWRIKRDRYLRGVLNDELTRAHSRRAIVGGYCALLIALPAALCTAVFNLVDAVTLLQGSIMVAVTVPIVLFVWYERA